MRSIRAMSVRFVDHIVSSQSIMCMPVGVVMRFWGCRSKWVRVLFGGRWVFR